MSEHEEKKTAPEEVQGHGSLLARFLWAMIGPVVILSLVMPVSKGPGWVNIWDSVYWANIALMIWGRYAEQKSGKGTTLYGESMTWSHFRAYVIKLCAFAIVVWIGAKIFGR